MSWYGRGNWSRRKDIKRKSLQKKAENDKERIIPLCIAMSWMITNLFLSDFVSAMQAMRLPNGFVITLTVIFRFFPTISYEFAKITSTMKMRGINPSLKNLVMQPLLTLEYAVVPLILRSMKIADDLTVAALTRGLTLSGTRTSYRKVRIRPVDIGGLFITTDTTSEIAFPCENAGMAWDQIVEKVQNAVDSLDIERLLGKSIFNLSSGEKQSIAIASVFTLSPSIYVFDEPSANLDTESTLKLQRILKILKDMGKTVIISEHKLYYLWKLVDKVVYMKNGHIERIFSGEEYRNLSNSNAHHMGLRCTQMEMMPLVHANFSQGQEIIKADEVSFGYGKNHTVLDRVSFHAQQGQVTGIIGHNGVGKSTLLELMCGIKRQKAGSFLFRGKVLNDKRRLQNSYYVMQECSYQLFTESVYKELLLGAEKDDKIRQRADYIIDFMDLSAYKDQHPAALSGGQKQRLAIAVAYMKNSEVICMDEPTSGLDYANMKKVKTLISQLSKEGKTVFIISHDYEFLADVCTHIIEINHTKIVDNYPLTEATVTKLFSFFISALQNVEKEAI